MGAAISLSWEQTPLGRLSLKQLSSLLETALLETALLETALLETALLETALLETALLGAALNKVFVLFPPCLDFSLIHFYTFYEHVHKRE